MKILEGRYILISMFNVTVFMPVSLNNVNTSFVSCVFIGRYFLIAKFFLSVSKILAMNIVI